MKKWFILATICLAWSLMWIDFTAVNVALAPIAADFHTSLGTLQWVITAYTLSSAALTATGGRLGDMFGHRRLFIIGTLIFIFSSGLAGFAPNATLLILSRVGQGIGIAMVVPITTALVYLTFAPKQRGLALGILTGSTGVSMAIGPTVGGILITYLNWRWVFFINIPIGLFAVALALILISETREKKKNSVDFPGIITLAGGMVSLLFALEKFSQWGFSSKFWALFIIAFLLLVIFVFIESRSREPLVHLDLLKHKTLMGIIGLRACMQYIFFVYMFIISLYLQNILGYSAAKTGYLLLTETAVLGILSPFAGHLTNYFSNKIWIVSSCIIAILSLLALIVSAVFHSLPWVIISLVIFGTAYAIHFPITNLAALQTVPNHQSALVTGMLFTIAFASGSIGVTISSTLLNNLSSYKLANLLTISKISLSAIQQNLMSQAASGIRSLHTIANKLPTIFRQKMTLIAQQSFVFSFNWVLIVCITLALAAMLVAILALKDKQPTKINKEILIPEI